MSVHQYNTRSKAQSQSGLSAKEEIQSEAVGNDNVDGDISTSLPKEELPQSNPPPEHELATNLATLLDYQRQLLADNEQLKQSLQHHEATIDRLVKFCNNLHVGNATPLVHTTSSTAASTSHAIPSVSAGDHTMKQLRSKQLTHLFESTPFAGTAAQDVVDWLDEFNRKCDDIQLDDGQRLSIARGLMKDDAKLWVETLKNVLVDWPTFQNRLVAYFQLAAGLDAFSFSEQLFTRQQQLNESAIHYYHDIIRLCAKVDGNMNDLTRLRHLYRGLRPESKVLFSIEKFIKPEQFLQELVRIEQLHNVAANQSSVEPTLASIDDQTASLCMTTNRRSGSNSRSYRKPFQFQSQPSTFNSRFQRRTSSRNQQPVFTREGPRHLNKW